jgi:predicted GTPase
MHDRRYEKKMQTIEKFIRKHGTTDHAAILNEVDIDYDTLMRILSELSNKGRLK